MTTHNQSISQRVKALPWDELHDSLDARGFAQTPRVLSARECQQLDALYEDGSFRSTITMARHRFGAGEYKYFDNPLPSTVAALREAFYEPLAHAANRWSAQLGNDERYPAQLAEFLRLCHAAGQDRPTPLLLRYGKGDWNALHQDIYGEIAFPFQIVTVLSRPGKDFTGGEFVLVEQRPRAQSRAHVIELQRGAFLIFTTRERPAEGSRGYYRAAMRHGVSTMHSGQRTALGVIFHDAS
jgi:hypothetical protein